MRRIPKPLLCGVVALAAGVALAQPAPTEIPTRAPIVLPSTPTPAVAPTQLIAPATRIGTSPTPALVTTTAGIATPLTAATPLAAMTPVLNLDAASAPPPGSELALALPIWGTDATTPLGNADLFATLPPMEKAWFVRGYYRDHGDTEAAAKYLRMLVDVARDQGRNDATAFSAALVREARAARKDGRAADALIAAKAATELAPDYPAAHLALARAEIVNGSFGPAFNAIELAVRAAGDDVLVRGRLLADLSVALLAGAWIAFGLFLAVALTRHTRFLAHDLRHAFNDHLPKWLSAAVIVPALLFPVLFGLGPLPLLAWISLVLWTRFLPRERVVTAAFLALGLFTPMIATQIGTWLAFDAGLEGRLHRIGEEDAVDAHTLAELSTEADATKDADLLITLGNLHQRSGRYGIAESIYRRAAEAGAGAAAEVGIGLARYGQGDEPGAIAAFDRAVAADGNDVAAHFNLSQIFAERTELDKSQTHLHAAKAVDPRSCDRLLASPPTPASKLVTGRAPLVNAGYINRLLLFDDVKDDRLLARVIASGAGPRIARRTFARLFPAVPLGVLTPLFAAALVASGILSVAFRKATPTQPCNRCGSTICIACDGPPLQAGLCTQCFHAFVQPEGTDPKIRAAKEQEVGAYHGKLRLMRRALAVIVPGGGHLFGGSTVRGAVFLLLASLLAARVFLWRGLIRPEIPDGGSGPLVMAIVCGVLLAAVWLLSQRGLSDNVERGR